VLLDEPLANLDVNLRAAMEDEFARFHARTGTTMIYITHDQAEAMALAHRIAVMDHGRLLQVATPSVLYREPANETVARFVGEGMVMPAIVHAVARDGTCMVETYGHTVQMRCAPTQQVGAASVCLRARDLSIVDTSVPGIAVRLARAVYQGGYFHVEVDVVAAPEMMLHMDVLEPFAVAAGAVMKIAVNDGWVIPAA
jgi:iron(III) transport system ATP-binding protein